MLIYSIMRTFSRLYLRPVEIEWDGLEHVPQEGGAILAANHPSALDQLMIMAKLERPYCCVQRSENFKNPVANWWLRQTRARPAGKDIDNTESFRAIERWIREGSLFLTGPEGDVSLNNNVGPFSKGFVSLARKLNVPVIPVAIWGTEKSLIDPRRPRGLAGFRVQPCHVRIAFLEPVHIPAYKEADAACAEEIRQTIIRKRDGWSAGFREECSESGSGRRDRQGHASQL